MMARAEARFGTALKESASAPRLEDINLEAPRVTVPASLPHIDDFVESLRTVTPRGVIESRRLPGSGAGPSPDRMMIGSEGILGVITQAWMRLQDRPKFRDGGAVRFKDFFSAARAVRAISQARSEEHTSELQSLRHLV